jgi:hypothetical protein
MDEIIFCDMYPMDDVIFFNGSDWLTLVNSLENREESKKIQSFIIEKQNEDERTC